MRREFAEVAMKMFVRVERESEVSAKQLENMAVGRGLSEGELAKCKLSIAKYMNRRRWLKSELTKWGMQEIVSRLMAPNTVNWSDFLKHDVDLKVGPFGYTLLTSSQNIGVLDPSHNEDDSGCAIMSDTPYPWSYVVTDKVGPIFAEDRLIAAIFGEPEVSDIERHENMHQFEAFLRELWGGEDAEYSCLGIIRMTKRLEKMRSLNAPKVILDRDEDVLASMIESLPDGGQDEVEIRRQAEREISDWIRKRLKTELLAFLWSVDIKYLVRRLRCRYLSKWLAQEEDMYGIDVTAQFEELNALLETAVARVFDQISELYCDYGYGKHASVRMAAMMNIDRPLEEWGV